MCIRDSLYSSLIASMSNLIVSADANWAAHKQGGQRFMSIKAVTYCHLYSLQQKLLEVLLHSKKRPASQVITPPADSASLTTVLPRYTLQVILQQHP